MQEKYRGLFLAVMLGVLPTAALPAPPTASVPCDGNPPLLPSFTPLPLQTPAPNPLGILRQGPFVYIPNAGDNTVSIIDLSASIPSIAPLTLKVGSAPQDIAIGPNGKYIYVSNYKGDTVSVIESPAHTVVATLPVGDGPASMALHIASGRLYVANQIDKSISVIDTATRMLIDTLTLSEIPDRLRVHPDTGHLYVLSRVAGRLTIIDPKKRVASDVSVFDGANLMAHDMVMDGTGAVIYITLHNTHAAATRAVIVSTASTAVFFPAISLPGPPKGLAIHPTQARLYVVTDIYANSFCQITRHASVHVIDVASRQLVQTLPIPQGADGISIDNRGWLYAANKKTGNQLEILDSANALVGQSITVGEKPGVLGQVVGPELGGILSISSEGDLAFAGTLPGAIIEHTVTVTNRGALAFTVQQPNIVTDPPGTDLGFSVAADACSGTTLAPDAQCQITLRFSPKSAGVVAAYFTVTSNALIAAAPIPIVALGLAPPAPVPVVVPPLPPIGGPGALDPWAVLALMMAGAWRIARGRTLD